LSGIEAALVGAAPFLVGDTIRDRIGVLLAWKAALGDTIRERAGRGRMTAAC